MKINEQLKDKRILIFGYGREGKSTYKFIRRHLKDKFITIIDKNDISNDNLIIEDNNIEVIFGDEYLNSLK